MLQTAITPLPYLILTRPTRSSLIFWSSLDADTQRQVYPLVSPIIEIEPLPAEDGFPDADAIVFSSTNGVSNGPIGDGRPAYCVGTLTTGAAEAAGWAAVMMGQTASDLIDAMKLLPNRPSLLHISGQHTRGDIVGSLMDAGFRVFRSVVYDQLLQDLTPAAKTALNTQTPKIVPIFSPRTAKQFAICAPQPTSTHVLALSRNVALPLASIALASVTIAEQPTADAMRSALRTWLNQVASG